MMTIMSGRNRYCDDVKAVLDKRYSTRAYYRTMLSTSKQTGKTKAQMMKT